MKVTSKKVCTILLELDQKEAEWLLSYVQNNLSQGDTETPEQYKNRESLFLGLKEELFGGDEII